MVPRRLAIRCTGAAAGTPLVGATGLFIEVEPSRFGEGAGLTLPGEDRLGWGQHPVQLAGLDEVVPGGLETFPAGRVGEVAKSMIPVVMPA
ncbi:MAG: hypothetical protein GY698_14605, partial [Actinomycetia bacterium]|nr:hypothetical protein [Actinomycetes bacterium]